MSSKVPEGIEQALDALTNNTEGKHAEKPALSCRIGDKPRSLSGPKARPRSPSSPSGRTGMPRSLDYMSPHIHNPGNNPFEYSLSKRFQNGELPDPYRRRFNSVDTDFRSALDYDNPDQREKEREALERIKRARRHDSWLDRESWNPRRWLSNIEGSPIEEVPSNTVEQTRSISPLPAPPRPLTLSRSFTQPHSSSPKSPRTPGQGWAKLRSIFPQIVSSAQVAPPYAASSVVEKSVNITDELLAGGLSGLMLKMWFERDEHGARRIPVLLHRVRVRVSDSIHPLHSSKAVFRIECEYANGAAKWVIYRQLRDLLSLHAHYRVSNAYNRNINALPEFPMTSLPYLKFLKRQNRERGYRDPGKTEFARLQREAVENYLVGLIRAVMFHPTSNRLCRFLEVSALSVQLAQNGGFQAKAGLLSIEGASSTKGAFGRKGLNWYDKRRTRWCAVREGYLVIVEDPGEIERPVRVYRQGFHLLQGHHASETVDMGETENDVQDQVERQNGTTIPATGSGSVRSKWSLPRVFGHKTTNSAQHSPRSLISSGSSSDTDDEPIRTPLVDPSTNVDPLREPLSEDETGPRPNPDPNTIQQEIQAKKRKKHKDVSKHTFFIENSQMKLKLFARNARQMQQWITALERTANASHWTGRNRFDSFAPIRLNVAAQWLVDGRDYFWNLSRAILLAKKTIYIHDWWLSPELLLRRPNKSKYRLDHLLEQKAKEGVKIYVIVYNEVSSRTTPTNSNYTKQRLNSLHENIFIQRSPSHFQTGTYYWAHHEKMCVIDEAIAFMGGLDLCFGRWDTPQHALIDDGEMEGGEKGEYIWPGKDYSNERVVEFHTLNKPEEDMYDRTKVPRMPCSPQAPQNHTRLMPFLLPPPEFKAQELTENGLTGTCELQICRSAGPWSLGTPARIEHSIQNAYLKAIQLSEHFVYIENQFFITSTVVGDVRIENKIGDALVHRIIRAHQEGTKWRAIIVIPLLPGFPSPIDQGEASSIRIILECQNRTIGRGPNSIFARLRKANIDDRFLTDVKQPDEYITFFSLRGWGKLKGEVLTTEQVYIHGKTMVVDDRLVIIGSANINERSQRGDRDSELASVIRDTDLIDGMMGGKPFKVGRFAHTLRVRLMREHLGVDVDALYDEDLGDSVPNEPGIDDEAWDPDEEQDPKITQPGVTRIGKTSDGKPIGSLFHDFKDAAVQGMSKRCSEWQLISLRLKAIHGSADATSKDAGLALRKTGLKPGGLDSTADDKALEEERQGYDREGNKQPNFATSLVPTIEEKTVAEHRPPESQAHGKPILDQIDEEHRKAAPGSNGTDTKATDDQEPPEARVHDGSQELYGAPADASRNAQTDDQPPHARQGKDDSDEQEKAAVQSRAILRRHLSARIGAKPWAVPVPAPKIDPHGFEDPICDDFFKNVWLAAAVHNTEVFRKVFHAIPDDLVTTWKQYKEFIQHHDRLQKPVKGKESANGGASENVAQVPSEAQSHSIAPPDSGVGSSRTSEDQTASRTSSLRSPDASEPRRPSRPDGPFEQWERDEMEALLTEVRGHLVVYPTRFLEGEDVVNNFLFPSDRLLPLPVYV
ncbi:hypothetical protein Clacol_008902 [Clathrus columnatus]|uniref:Phospholipase n=1 Tax=Clathrus columnatus TaxID=1419009 RepID=A0AAV5AP17_9AGAM|nr:hypothetical protein Clacol_008902 [Clathrus columnatus]